MSSSTSIDSGSLAPRMWWVRAPRPRLVLAVGLVGAVLAALGVREHREEVERGAFERRAAARARRLEESLVAPLATLDAVDAFMMAVPAPSPASFRDFARRMLAHHPSLAALEWAQVVAARDRVAFEAAMTVQLGHAFTIREPGPDARMMPASPRAVYVPLIWLEPHIEELVGLDAAFEPTRRRMFERAIARHGTAVSSRLRLVEDPPGVYSVIVIAPRFRDGSGADASLEVIQGVTIGLYRLAPLIGAALGPDHGEMRLALVEDTTAIPPVDRVLHTTSSGAEYPDPDGLVATYPITFAGERWRLVASRPRSGLWGVAVAWFVAVALASAATALAAAAVRALARARRDNRELRSFGQYTLVRRIGSGAMGHVYEATHALLRRRAAVKLIARADGTEAELARFEREAHITSELTHPNTVVVFDFGRTRSGDFYYAMEYLQGSNLHELVHASGPLPPARVRHLLVQICGAIAEAHDLGIVHRDLKPANVMVCARGGIVDFVKVLDFGLAKVTAAMPKLSRIDLRVGTPAYMAPEAFLSPVTVGPPADLYSLGCIAYFLLSGHDAFRADSPGELAAAHLNQEPPPFDAALGVPPELERLVMRCLAKDPDARFRSARQLAGRLERLALEPWTQADAAEAWSRTKLDGAVAAGSTAPRPIEIAARR